MAKGKLTIRAEPTSREHHKAKWWRKNVARLSVDDLALHTGYSRRAIYQFEEGCNGDGALHPESAWRRYRMACAGVHIMLAFEHRFNWGQ